MRTVIPRFLACAGKPSDTPENVADFPAIDIPVEDGKTQRGALMFSTSENAREFIAHNGGESAFHVRYVEYSLLRGMLATSHAGQFKCIAVDYLNNGKRGFVKCIDVATAVEALGWPLWASQRASEAGDTGEPIEAESWMVFI